MSAAPLTFQAQLEWARSQDAADPLAPLRASFALPRGADGRPLVYLCGHSLGLAPLGARAMLEAELSDWERLGVLGHEHAHTPWVSYAEQLQGPLAALVGAAAQEVVAMNSLTVNLHLLLAHFYRPAAARRAILIETGAFSSDRHAVATQIAWRGLDPASELIELCAPPGQTQLRVEDIEAAIGEQGERLALVLWPAVQYLTGQRFELARIARAAHAAGAAVGFDLAHAIGNVPLSLHADQADFAVWCSYKYLNAGPGAIGGAFVHERHLRGAPQLAGWWGHEGGTRFALSPRFVPAAGAPAFALSNPPILSSAPLRASLPLFAAAGLAALRDKSLRLTGYLEALLMQLADGQLQLLTPSDPEQRGCQLSVRVCGGSERAQRLHAQLGAQGVIGDLRAPDVIRLAPVPFYNSFVDVMRGAWQLCDALKSL
ncbi:MAG TPA: kynureninase [Steroidobacteraceae bacterium]|jgi:kynureninase|nr:kynureninase [Steroidobacteraceae bacterium]